MVDLPDGAEPSSLDQEDSVEGGGTGDGESSEVMLRSRESPPGIERRRSYQIATEDMEMLDACLLSETKEDDDDDDDKFVDSPKHTKPDLTSSKQTSSETIKRSISSVETVSMAAIKRRKNMNIPKPPRALSTACVSSNQQSASSLTSAHDSAYNSLKRIMSPQSSLEQLIDREISSGSYSTPLIGCIPPSALKCFAGEKKDPKNGSAVSPLSSPAHSQSGKKHTKAVKKTILCC